MDSSFMAIDDGRCLVRRVAEDLIKSAINMGDRQSPQKINNRDNNRPNK